MVDQNEKSVIFVVQQDGAFVSYWSKDLVNCWMSHVSMSILKHGF